MRDFPNEQVCETVGYEETLRGHAEHAVRWAKDPKASEARTSTLVEIASAMLDMNEKAANTSGQDKAFETLPPENRLISH